MQAWRQRVLITAAAAAMAGSYGVWFISVDRQRRLVIDEAEMAEAIMERYAALTFSTNEATVVGWTNVRFDTVGDRETWGGYSNVAITLPEDAMDGIGDLYDGTYTFSMRARTYDKYAAHRGFIDVYTNAGKVILDLGPSGGGWNGYRVGGWVIDELPPMSLIPGGNLEDAWFMQVHYAPGVDFAARDYDPEDCTATPGPVDSTRETFWTPLQAELVTNSIYTLPIYRELWCTNYSLSELTQIPGVEKPRVILAPLNPWLAQGARWGIDWRNMDVKGDRQYIDYTQAYDSETDFSNRTWSDADNSLPHITENDDYVAAYASWTNWVSTGTNPIAGVSVGTNAVLDRAAFKGLGEAVKLLRAMQVESDWTNGVNYRYDSTEFDTSSYGADLDAAYEAFVASPDFAVTTTTTNNLLGPEYTLNVQLLTGSTSTYFFATLDVCQARAMGLLGFGHNTNGANEATAHVITRKEYEVPDGETIVRAATNVLSKIVRSIDVRTAFWVPDQLVPGTAPVPPPASFWPTLFTVTNTGHGLVGFKINDNPVVVTQPAWKAAK